MSEQLRSLRALESFITGSQAYGTATEESDVDLVCFVSEETKQKLIELAGGVPIRFGKLNLILETTVGMLIAWKAALAECLDENNRRTANGLPPLTREEAVKIHNEFGIGVDNHKSPSGPREFSDDR